ncbi:MAG: EF-P lysine aminoacylase GenX [Gammaproteobacteria bacterium]|nr:EF-P lysine aminoacylase GenX [Gammaproteobacteria bacterium]NNF59985.1 EF-P lysine aminoacylase GenX [Gammaproteobacteria bacterium]NNM21455.1 EF-P lysine aminoacylase GenX [Gammaproteobacteria bacterium]
MNWQPAAGPEVLAARARLLAETRDFFVEHGVLEVQTPVLVGGTCPDPAVPSIPASPAGGRSMFLHTSPEHAMKRLLCAGSGDIYQVCPVFRDGESGRLHNPEFTMVEWYRTGFDQRRMARETVALVARLLQRELDPLELTYGEAFRQTVGIDPHTADAESLERVCHEHGIATPQQADRDALLDLLLSTVIATGFAADRCHVVYDYPASQAALARISATKPFVAERFEVFFGSVELANGFHELSDPAEQRRRFTAERQQHAHEQAPPLDERLLAALDHGLPDCAGVALGFDRVLMLATGCTSIADVLSFPFERI